MENVEKIYKQLKDAGIRVYLDDSENYNPGFKFNYWELKGIPIRMEIGEKDIKKGVVTVVKRISGKKEQV